MSKKKPKKRQYLGTGFIWFSEGGPSFGYHRVSLTTGKNGCGSPIKIRVGRIGGWQKVRLYAELIGR